MIISEVLHMAPREALFFHTKDWKVIKLVSKHEELFFDISTIPHKKLKKNDSLDNLAFYELEEIFSKDFNNILLYLSVEEDDDWTPQLVNNLNNGIPVGYNLGNVLKGGQLSLILLRIISNTLRERVVFGIASIIEDNAQIDSGFESIDYLIRQIK